MSGNIQDFFNNILWKKTTFLAKMNIQKHYIYVYELD